MRPGRVTKAPAIRPAQSRVCIVMACTDMSEAEQVGWQLLQFDRGCLITYRRAEDLKYNSPSGKVALVILATNDTPVVIRCMLRWLRNKWVRCPVAVVGDLGCGELEMAVRQGGASYLLRPVASEMWSALVSHVLGEEAGIGRMDESSKERLAGPPSGKD